MAMIRPTLILGMDLDERVHADELVADLRRAYMHIAGSQVGSRPASEGPLENVIRFNMKMRKPCWNLSDEGAEDQWQGVMVKWLHNMFYKVSANMVAFNRMRIEGGKAGMTFSWLELDFGGSMLLRIHLNADSSIPGDAQAWVEKARRLWNEGALGLDVASVSIPSEASYAEQAASHIVAGESVGGGEDMHEACSESDFVPDQGQEAPSDSADSVEAAEGAESAESAPSVSAIPEVEPFEIDFSTWGITRKDGTMEEIDA